MTVVHVDALPVVDDVALYIAWSKGWFRQAGLDLRVTTAATSAIALPHLMSGQEDVVAGSNYVSVIKMVHNGHLPLKVLADGYAAAAGTDAVLALPSSGIHAPRDLYGKKVAFSLVNSVTTATFDAAMRAHNADPNRVQKVAVPFPSMAAALANHSIAACYMVEPFITYTEQQLSAKPILDPTADHGPTAHFPMSGYITTTGWVTKHPQAAAAFRKVIERAQAVAADRGQVEKMLPGYTKITKQTAAMITLGEFPTSIDPHRLGRVITRMRTEHMLPAHGPLTAASLIAQVPAS